MYYFLQHSKIVKLFFSHKQFQKGQMSTLILTKNKNKRRPFYVQEPFLLSFFPCQCILFCDFGVFGKKAKLFFSNFPTFTFIAFLFHLFSRETVLFLSNCYRFPIGSNKRNTIPIIEMPIPFVFLFFYYREGCKNLLKFVNVYFAFYFRILRKFVTKSKT